MFLSLPLIAIAALQPVNEALPPQSCISSDHPSDNSAIEGSTIPIFGSNREPLVMVSLAGGAHLPFTFDTGSSGNLVSLQVAKQMELPENGPSPSVDGNGNPVPGFDTCLNELSISGVGVTDRRATAFPFDRLNKEGIISPMQFSGSILKFDGPNLELEILSQEHELEGFSRSRNWYGPVGDMRPAADVDLGGVTVEVVLDSGSDAAFLLPLELIDRLPLDSEPVEVGFSESAAGLRTPVFRARITGQSTVLSEKIDGLEVLFAAVDHGLLGWPLMKDLVFYMDPENGVSYFPEAEASKAKDSPVK